jgi:glucokinase
MTPPAQPAGASGGNTTAADAGAPQANGPAASDRAGRPALPTIGIDIGGTSVRAAVVDAGGTILHSTRASTPRTVPGTESLLAEMIADLSARQPVSAVGLAVAGFISTDRTRVMFAPHLAWRDAPVPERMSQLVGLPVVMDHDVNSAVWAEHRLGAARGSRVALLVAVGTGIGAGLVLDGAVYRGAFGVAPELGHIVVVPDGRSCPCGKRGCWERYCSGTALAQTARELWEAAGPTTLTDLAGGNPHALTGAMVASAAADGDPVALEAMADLGRWLAVGLAVAVDVLDPEVVVIGGGVSGAADLFLPAARSALIPLITGGANRPRPRLELARFGDAASVVGAALLAAEVSAR